MDARLIRSFREGFTPGETRVVSEDDAIDGVGFDFAIHRQRAGARLEERAEKEAVWVLMSGEARVTLGDASATVRRASLFDEPPSALSVCAGDPIAIDAVSDTEWAVARTSNARSFEPRLFTPEMLSPEYRGRGLAQDMSLRNVRLIFDWNERAESRFVIGEVVNYPGRWSSYPPHHHAQPELYHYRFTEPEGYGHAELDEHVFKVRANDSIKIMGGETHAQVAAPGYGMYYLWIVRHLDDRPYRGFEYAPAHRWLLDPARQGWRPTDGDG